MVMTIVLILIGPPQPHPITLDNLAKAGTVRLASLGCPRFLFFFPLGPSLTREDRIGRTKQHERRQKRAPTSESHVEDFKSDALLTPSS